MSGCVGVWVRSEGIYFHLYAMSGEGKKGEAVCGGRFVCERLCAVVCEEEQREGWLG